MAQQRQGCSGSPLPYRRTRRGRALRGLSPFDRLERSSNSLSESGGRPVILVTEVVMAFRMARDRGNASPQGDPTRAVSLARREHHHVRHREYGRARRPAQGMGTSRAQDGIYAVTKVTMSVKHGTHGFEPGGRGFVRASSGHPRIFSAPKVKGLQFLGPFPTRSQSPRSIAGCPEISFQKSLFHFFPERPRPL